ncbi:MAG: MATE family efflux transporter [Muribaculaceae bacterium]|nr:MATE family efflux transporter [Bacteroides sp.]MDE6843143.1 MATE family efflux transporter [Muribaculaceae bacterium]MDE7190008.1 MATE family efflux transporter [Muribaculaceae bacterium]
MSRSSKVAHIAHGASIWNTYKQAYAGLLRLGLPVLVTQVGIIVVSFADTMMVGAYGLDELAAAAFVNSFFMVAIVMQFGFAGGITPLIGALYSKGRRHEAGRTLRAGLQVNTMVSVFFMALMGTLYFFLDCFGQPEELLPLIRPYYLVILGSLLPMAIFNCCQQTANGTTDTAMPMWLILGANIFNIIGNYTLIFGHFGCPRLGLIGAGLSTLTARTGACIGILLCFSRRRRYREYWRGVLDSSPGVSALRREVWVTSYPVAIQSGVECALWTLGAVVSGWFGKVQLAAYQVVNTIAQLGFMIYLSVGTATSIRVANCTGVRDVTGIRRTAAAGLHLNLLLGTLASVVFLVWTRPLIHLFSPDEPVILAAMSLIVPLVLYQYGDAIQITYANALRGTSEVRPLLWVAVVSYLVIGAPLMLLMAVTAGMGTIGVYYSFSGALISASLLLWCSFSRVCRRKQKVWEVAADA